MYTLYTHSSCCNFRDFRNLGRRELKLHKEWTWAWAPKEDGYELTVLLGVLDELGCLCICGAVRTPEGPSPTLEMRPSKPPAANLTLGCDLGGRLLHPTSIYVGMKRKWSLRPCFFFFIQKTLTTISFGDITPSTEASQATSAHWRCLKCRLL